MSSLLEAVCTSCNETFNPADENDLIHGDCGGAGVLTGEWRVLTEDQLEKKFFEGETAAIEQRDWDNRTAQAFADRIAETIQTLAGQWKRCYTEERKDDRFHQGRAQQITIAIGLLMGMKPGEVKKLLAADMIPTIN